MPQHLMLAVLKEKASAGVTIKQIPVPKPKKDEVLVKVRAASLCGTDINIYDWNSWARSRIKPPVVIGHEIVGEVVEINGKKEGLKKGDLVSSETHIYCDRCDQCTTGNRHICERMTLFGIGRDGGFAQYATIPLRTVWKNDQKMPLEIMSIQEPLGNALHAVEKAEVKDKVVGIWGLGPIGILAGMVALRRGAKEVFGIDPVLYRRSLAEKMGINRVFDSMPKAYRNRADVTLEMSGNPKAVNDCLEAVRIAGTVLFFGIPKKTIPMDIGKYMINKELTTKGVFGRQIWQTWEDVQSLLKENKLDLSPIVTHTLMLEDFEKAVGIMKSGECGKIVLLP